MFLPETIRVGPFKYNVIPMKDGESEQLDAHGSCSNKNLVIKIDKGQADQMVVETLFHEIEHAINHLADVDDKTEEEDAVRRTTPLRLAVFRDNPDLFRLLKWMCDAPPDK